MYTCEFCYKRGAVDSALLLEAIEISHVLPCVARLEGKCCSAGGLDSLRQYLLSNPRPSSFEFYDNPDYQDPGFCMFTAGPRDLQNIIWSQLRFSADDIDALRRLSEVPDFNYGYLLPLELYEAQDLGTEASEAPDFPFIHTCIPGMSSLLGIHTWLGPLAQSKLKMEALQQFEEFEVRSLKSGTIELIYRKGAIGQDDYKVFKALQTALGFNELVLR